MHRFVHWDLTEIVRETKQVYPGIENLFPNFHEAVNDLASMALRDRSMGTNDNLDDFIDNNLSSDFQFLGLFFRNLSINWYREIVQFVTHAAREYDEFSIDDIVQHSPTVLIVKVNVIYHYEGSPLTEQNDVWALPAGY